jgi:class 3 adenylate cyclase
VRDVIATVALLFTDIEGSTRLWERDAAAMAPALARHDELLRGVIEGNGGRVFKTVGDAFCAAFAAPRDAVAAARAGQAALAAEPWPDATRLRVRMAIHVGECEQRDDDYFGPPVNRVARLLATGHGSQVLLSGIVAELVGGHAELRDLGEHRLKDLGRPERVFQLLAPGLEDRFPPLRLLGDPRLRHNLPEQPSTLVGREREIADVVELLRRSRLVTLTGGAGPARRGSRSRSPPSCSTARATACG